MEDWDNLLKKSIQDICLSIVEKNYKYSGFEQFNKQFFNLFGLSLPFDKKEYDLMSKNEVYKHICNTALENIQNQIKYLSNIIHPIVSTIYKRGDYKNIQVPFIIAGNSINVTADLEMAYQTNSEYVIYHSLLKHIISEKFIAHCKINEEEYLFNKTKRLDIELLNLENLYQDIFIRKKESIIPLLLKAQIHYNDSPPITERKKPVKEKEKIQPVRVEKKVGRNDPCPCGSGKKYKHCHGKLG